MLSVVIVADGSRFFGVSEARLLTVPGPQLSWSAPAREVETRTNAYQIRTGEFQDEQVSVYVTARQYGSLSNGSTFVEIIDRLARICREVVDGYVVDSVLQPLARAIALQ